MNIAAVFGLSVLMSFLAYGIVTRLYIWPRLRVMSREDALTALCTAHISFRWAQFSGAWRRITVALLGFRGPGGVRRPRCSNSGSPCDVGPSGARILGHRDCMGIQRVGCSRPVERNLQWPDRCPHRCQVAGGGVLYSDSYCASPAHFARVDILDSVAA